MWMLLAALVTSIHIVRLCHLPEKSTYSLAPLSDGPLHSDDSPPPDFCFSSMSSPGTGGNQEYRLLWQALPLINCRDVGECFSVRDDFDPVREHTAISGNICGCHNWGEEADVPQWEEVRVGSELTALHRNTPTLKPYLSKIPRSWKSLS